MVNACVVAALATAVSSAVISRGEIFAVAPTDESDYLVNSDDVTVNFIGGEPASVKDYPTVIAALRSGGPRPQGQACSGSVIGPRKILTAAHCADASGTKSFAYGHDNLEQGTIKKIPVLTYKKHPRYSNFQQGYDVAVVTTTEDIPVPGGVYAKFATSADKGIATPGKQAFGLGYGKKDVNDDQRNVELHRADLPIVEPATCDKSGNGLRVLPATMICAGYANGRPVTILPGDSGGPLYVDGKIVGVASWGRSNWDWHSIYARLDNDMGDWVAQELKK